MTWTIAGDSSDVLVCVSAHGNRVIRGEGSHTPYITDEWVSSDYPAIAEALRRLMMVKADWRILCADAVREEIIDSAALFKVIEANAGKSVAAITCFDRKDSSEPALSFTIALNPQTFHRVYDLFSKLIGSTNLKYAISVDFLTFRSPGASADIPTLHEFTSGHPYFSDTVSVSIRHA